MICSIIKTRREKQSGYTLLLVVFMVATMLIAAAAVTPSILTEGRREKEADMVWRGEQYARAIGLYYQKFGKYPTRIEDLTKQTNGVRFLRQAYKDPMNKEDGSWRFIYVGPNGQLIGSLRPTTLLQNSLNTQGIGATGLGGGLQPLTQTGLGTAPGQQTGTGAAGQQTNPASAANPLESQPQPFEGAVLGGNIIGVGSKIKIPSFKIYMGGETYQQWEFIWNPTGQLAIPGQAPVNPNANPAGAPNAANPNGTNPNGTNPNAANPNGTAPTGPDGQPVQSPQTPVINVPPPTSPAQ